MHPQPTGAPAPAPRTLPLYDPAPADPDGWHAVRSPGGYEWWYFDAQDATGRLRLVAIFLEGFVFHPGYLRRYHRYLARPTRHAPPVPAEYPCAYFAVYEAGRVLAQFMTQVRPDEFSASGDGTDVRVGANTVRRAADGSLRLGLRGVPWQLTWRGPRRSGSRHLSADLAFTPALRRPGAAAPPPHERVFLSREMSGAEHHWVIADPLCGVEGEIRLGGASPRTLHFTGLGYHDHNYGTAPIGPGLRRWLWGRMLWEDRMVTFHYARPSRRGLPDEVHWVEADADGVREVPGAEVKVEDDRTALGLAYPGAIRVGGGPDQQREVRLFNPKVIDASPFYLRLTYDGTFRRGGGGSEIAGTAFCEAAYPHRLRWPVLGRMIEMSIEKPAGRPTESPPG